MHMEMNEYIKDSAKTERVDWKIKSSHKIILYGLIGEIGSLFEVTKKAHRDHKSDQLLKLSIADEVGDILWYLSAIARRLGALELKWPEHTHENKNTHLLLTHLVKQSSQLLEHHQEIQSGTSSPELWNLLQDLLTHLSWLASVYELDISIIAEEAIIKNNDYWGIPTDCAPVFDSNYADYEKLPRKFTINFKEINDTQKELIISLKGVQLGDRLTDNTSTETGYRYHDVFHMTAATFLGWSPVFRRMLKRKRKSDPKVDVVQDGARAAIIEEAIVSQVYRYGNEINFKPTMSVDDAIVKLIMKMAQEYECKDLKGRDWRLYVIQSIKLFGKIHNGFNGQIEFDADSRSYRILD